MKIFQRICWILFMCITSVWATASADTNDLKTLQERTQRIIHKIQHTQNTENAPEHIIVVGPTGSGKSTLIHALAGKNITAEKPHNAPFIIKVSELLPGFRISDTNAVGTHEPCAWVHNNTLYWDCPGFGDPRGPRDDIVNAFSLNSLFKGRTKIVVVANESHLQVDRGTGFLKLMEDIVRLFPSCDALIHNIAFIFTRQRDIDNPCDYIKESILPEGIMSDDVRKVLSYYTQNGAHHFGVLPYPTHAGSYETTEIIQTIRNAIQSAQFIEHATPRIVLSPESKLLTLDFSEFLNQNIRSFIQQDIAKKLIDFCERTIAEYYNPSAHALRDTFLNVSRAIKPVDSLTPRETFDALCKALGAYINIDPLNAYVNQLCFLESLNASIHVDINAWIQAISQHLKIFEPLYSPPHITNNNVHVTVQGVLVDLSEISMFLKTQHALKTLDIFAAHTLFLDESIYKTSLENVNIIAPIWNVTTNCELSFIGDPGAQGQSGACVPYEAHENGRDGQPGGPGEPGASFYGRGEKFINMNNLSIKNHGGHGGYGGHGGTGGRGQRGTIADQHNIIRIENNAWQESFPPAEPGYFNGENINKNQRHIYQSLIGDIYYYGGDGSNGGRGFDGGRAGAGGFGGLAGELHIDGYHYHNNPIPPILGTPGRPGLGGEGGEPGAGYASKIVRNRRVYYTEEWNLPGGWYPIHSRGIKAKEYGNPKDGVIIEPGEYDSSPYKKGDKGSTPGGLNEAGRKAAKPVAPLDTQSIHRYNTYIQSIDGSGMTYGFCNEI